MLPVIGLLVTSSVVSGALRCLSGHSQFATQCTSQSYCITISSRNGPIQRSCDGNSISQISLCSMYAMHGIPRSIQTDYSSYSIPSIASGIGSSSSSSSSSSSVSSLKHTSPSARGYRRSPVQMCFNAGDLGEVCCCNTDFCNSSSYSTFHPIYFFIPLIIVFLL